MQIKRVTRTVAIVAAAAIAPPLHAQGNLTELSAADAAKLIRAGKLKSEDLVKARRKTRRRRRIRRKILMTTSAAPSNLRAGTKRGSSRTSKAI